MNLLSSKRTVGTLQHCFRSYQADCQHEADQGYSEEDKMPNEGVDQDAPQEKIPDEVIEQVLAQFAQQEQASAEGSQVQKK